MNGRIISERLSETAVNNSRYLKSAAMRLSELIIRPIN